MPPCDEVKHRWPDWMLSRCSRDAVEEYPQHPLTRRRRRGVDLGAPGVLAPRPELKGPSGLNSKARRARAVEMSLIADDRS